MPIPGQLHQLVLPPSCPPCACRYWCYNQTALSGNLALDFALGFEERAAQLLTGYNSTATAIAAYRTAFRGERHRRRRCGRRRHNHHRRG
jgi:hypothetical protein